MPRQEAYERLRHRIGHSPEHFGVPQSRWTLQSLLALCGDWLHVRTLPGLWRILRRLRIRFKRARFHVHSPDPGYDRKRERIAALREDVHEGAPIHLLYLDEVSFTRQPTLASDWCAIAGASGGLGDSTHRPYAQPLAEMSHRSNSKFRVLGALDATTGQLHTVMDASISVDVLLSFFKKMVSRYPTGEVVYVVVDNWPVHYHPDLLVHLVEQPFVADFIRPANWPTQPSKLPPSQPLPLVLVPLPTYSPWLNPIEKVWRLCRTHVTHLHRHADHLATLKQRVRAYFETYASGSRELLDKVGLLQE